LTEFKELYCPSRIQKLKDFGIWFIRFIETFTGSPFIRTAYMAPLSAEQGAFVCLG